MRRSPGARASPRTPLSDSALPRYRRRIWLRQITQMALGLTPFIIFAFWNGRATQQSKLDSRWGLGNNMAGIASNMGLEYLVTTSEIQPGKSQIARRPFPDDCTSACLLIKDDNHWLIEWLAYHYYTINLRYLIVAPDPDSKTSPMPIFERWRPYMDITVFGSKEVPPQKLPPKPTADDRTAAFVSRQRTFYSACLSELKAKNRSLTALIDTDEFLVINPETANPKHRMIYRNHSINFTAVPGEILRYLRQEQARGKDGSDKCFQMGRVQFTSIDGKPGDQNRGVPREFNASDFLTLRWRTLSQDIAGPKNFVDLRTVNASSIERPMVPNQHQTIPDACPHPRKPRFWNRETSKVLVYHYIGTAEQYFFRVDARVNISVGNREEAYNVKISHRVGKPVDLNPWLQGFVNQMGIEEAKRLLKHVGQVNPPKESLPEPEDTTAACLLIKDDNHWLIEWLAYHYYTINLRHVIVAPDPQSKTSPRHILERWQSRMNITIFTDRDIYGWRGFPGLPTKFHGYKSLPPDQKMPWRLAMAFVERQRYFYSSCLSKLKGMGHSFTFLIDTDEYLVINPATSNPENPKLYRENVPSTTAAPGGILQFLRQEQNGSQQSCWQMGRVQMSGKDVVKSDTVEGLPSFQAQNFLTLRWRKMSAEIPGPKNMIDLRLVPKYHIRRPMIFNQHQAIPKVCRPPEEQWTSKKCPILVYHYLGTEEQYFFRADPRTNISTSASNRTETYYQHREADGDWGVDLNQWVRGFVNLVGETEATRLLQSVGSIIEASVPQPGTAPAHEIAVPTNVAVTTSKNVQTSRDVSDGKADTRSMREFNAPPLAPQDMTAACLLVKDDNHWLIEWLAYHFYTINLRHVIVAPDRDSKTSATHIYDRWKGLINITVFGDTEVYGPKGFPGIPDNFPHLRKVPLEERMPWRLGMAFIERQRYFYSSCLREFKAMNRHFTVLIDTDEFLVINPATQSRAPKHKSIYRKSIPNITASSGAILKFMKQEQQLTGRKCFAMGRVQMSGFETLIETPVGPGVIPSDYNPYDFLTLRWRGISEDIGGPKNFVDLTQVPDHYIERPMIPNQHHTIPKVCESPTKNWNSATSLLLVYHYLGTKEQYFFRDDPRTKITTASANRTSSYFKHLKHKEGMTGLNLNGWLKGFVDLVGEVEAKRLLKDAGKLEHPDAKSTGYEELVDDSTAACLLIKDDNHWLIEWLAYHYYTINLRQLIVAPDPASRTSPNHILDRWKSRINITIYGDKEVFRGMGAPPIRGSLALRSTPADEIEAYKGEQAFIARQRHFYSACLSEFKAMNQSFTVMIDTDEFLVINQKTSEWDPDPEYNRVYRPNVPSITAAPGGILKFMRQEQARSGRNCFEMGRVQMSGFEVLKRKPVNLSSVPSFLDAFDFLTLRWQKISHDIGGPKNFVDLRKVKSRYIGKPHIPNQHHTIPKVCRPTDMNWSSKTSVLLVYHYLGTEEQYFFREDPRMKLSSAANRSAAYHQHRETDGKWGAKLIDWLKGFVELVGEDEAKLLLKDAGKLEFPSSKGESAAKTLSTDNSQLASGSSKEELNDTTSACLLIKDDNHWLIEWLAYHYYSINLRHLIVAPDPESQTSPIHILDRWKSLINITVFGEKDVYGPQGFPGIPDNFPHLHKVPVEERMPWRLGKAFIDRQRYFYSSCLTKFKAMNHSFTVLTDTDEYLVINPKTSDPKKRQLFRKDVPSMTASPGAVLKFVRQEQQRSGKHCFVMGRVQMSGFEVLGKKPIDLSDVPAFVNPKDFMTLRWRKISKDIVGPKNFVDLRGISIVDIEKPMVPNQHHTVPKICAKPGAGWNRDTSLVLVYHYLGTRQQYFFRVDPRTNITEPTANRTHTYLKHRNIDGEWGVALNSWLRGFVDLVGLEQAKILLQDAGKVETPLAAQESSEKRSEGTLNSSFSEGARSNIDANNKVRVQSKDDTASACLLIKDDNHWLIEWLAYHYYTANLRNVIVAPDSTSKTSPVKVLDRWKKHMNITVFGDKEVYGPKGFPGLPTKVPGLHRVPLEQRLPWRQTMAFIHRQKYFYSACLSAFKAQNRSLTMLIDTDEFLVINPKTTMRGQKMIYRESVPNFTAAPGGILRFLREEQARNQNKCFQMGRVQISAQESSESKRSEGVPTFFNASDFLTLRWRRVASDAVGPKNFVDLQCVEKRWIAKPMVPNQHQSVPKACPHPREPHFWNRETSLVLVYHYLGSAEQYFFREDARSNVTDRGTNRTDAYYKFQELDIGRGVNMNGWLQGFVDLMGADEAVRLLSNVGEVEEVAQQAENRSTKAKDT